MALWDEKSGVATTLTALSIDGTSQPLSGIFASTAIPANGSIFFSGAYTPGAPVASSVFHFAGQDADGSTWSEDVTVQYAESTVTRLAPGITIASSAASVAQDPAAEPACRWSHVLTVRETGGFLTQLTTLRQGSTSLNANIQQIFGTTRLAPFGVLSGTVCLDSSAVGGTRLYTVSGVSEFGSTVTATASVAFAGPVAAPAKLTSATPSITYGRLARDLPDRVRHRIACLDRGAAREAGMAHPRQRGRAADPRRSLCSLMPVDSPGVHTPRCSGFSAPAAFPKLCRSR